MSDRANSKYPLQEFNRETQKTRKWGGVSGKVAALSKLYPKIKEVLEGEVKCVMGQWAGCKPCLKCKKQTAIQIHKVWIKIKSGSQFFPQLITTLKSSS